MEQLLQLDKNLFLFINHLPHNLLFDSFFSLLSFVGYFGAIWFVFLLLLLFWEEIKEKKALFTLIFAWGFALISEMSLKSLFGRLRPEFRISEVIVVLDKTTSLSFPSGHATIAFASVYILSFYHRKWAMWYYLFAILISFSRIYLGKHYPSDVVAGAIVGTCIGYLSNAGYFRHKKS